MGRGSLACLACLFRATSAHADPASVLSVDYAVPAACPSEGAFEDLVRRRTPVAHFDAAEAEHVLHLRVRAAGATFEGHLSMHAAGGALRERDVSGDDCATVVDALALVTALTLDPHASVALTPLAPSAATSPAPEAAASLPPPPAPPSPPPEAKDAIAPKDASAPAPARASDRWRFAIGVGPAVWSGVAPDVMLGGTGFVELAPDRTSFFAPSFRLAAVGLANGVFESPSADIWIVAGRLDGCALRVGSNVVSVRLCAAVDVGGVHAVAVHIAHPLPAERFWLDIVPLLRGRWAPWGSAWFVDADVGLLLPITRPTFVDTTPDAVVHAVPSVGLNAMATLGRRF